MRSQLELLEIQDQEAVKNTYYRYPKVTPHIRLFDDYLEVKTIDDTAIINTIDEIVLYIIARFRWAPAWLIQQWYEVYKLDGYSRIEQFIRVGLVWAQTGSTGVFIRPTYFLFEMTDIYDNVKVDPKTGKTIKYRPNYVDIPFNLLNHTCAEMQIVFDVMAGNRQSEIWVILDQQDVTKQLPMYHPLQLRPSCSDGRSIYIEDEYKCTLNPDALLSAQDTLNTSINNRDKFTAEFQDSSLFTLVIDDSENSKYGLYTQRPDLVIPALRNLDGTPNSVAIELELSPKTGNRYDKIMNSYQNNKIYGTLIYLCGNNYIVEQVKKANRACEGLGTCSLRVIPWTAPAQRITNYSSKEETAYRQLLDTTLDSTKAKKET